MKYLWTEDTGSGKKDKIKIRKEILTAMDDHRIDISKINDEKTIQYLAKFKRFSTERVMKALTGELTENEKWSIKGARMGDAGIRIAVYLSIRMD